LGDDIPQPASSERRSARRCFLAPCYFVKHLLDVACHMPPAFSQSDFVVCCERSLEVPDGLAEGELDEPLDAPGVVVEPLPEAPE